MSHNDPSIWERRTLKFRFERDLFVALCGGALYFSYCKQPPVTKNDLLLSLLITSALYLFYRWLHIGFKKSISIYVKELALPAIICLSCLYFIENLTYQFYLNLGLSLIICYLYNLKIGQFRIRLIPYLKSILIAFLWVWILVYLPLSFSNIQLSGLVVILLENFLFILALTVMYDIYDIEEDENHGIKTLVNFNLSKGAVRNVILLLSISNIPGLLYITTHYTYSFSVLANLIPCVIGILLLLKYGKESKKGLLLIWDGLILLKAIILLAIVYMLIK